MIRRKNFFRVLLIWLAMLACLSALLFATGCRPSRRDQSSLNERADSSVYKENDRLRREIDEIQVNHDREIRELAHNWIEFDVEPCPEISIDTSCSKDSLVLVIRKLERRLKDADSKVKVLADGSIEAKGQIKSASSKADRYSREIDELGIRNEQLVRERDILQAELNKVREVKSKIERRGLPRWLAVLYAIIFIVIGVAIRHYWKNIPAFAGKIIRFIKHQIFRL